MVFMYSYGGGGGAMFSTAALFSAYASLTAVFTLFQQFYNQFVPKQVRLYISNKLEEIFNKKAPTSLFTLVIEQTEDGDRDCDNQVYEACEAYLATKLKSSVHRLRVSRRSKKENVLFKLAQGATYCEEFEGIQLQWKYVCNNDSDSSPPKGRKNKPEPGNNYFELSFEPDHKDKILDSYLTLVLNFYDDLSKVKKDLFLLSHDPSLHNGWKPVKFRHPFTFDALALEPHLKKEVIDDLDRFMKRKKFYKKVGRAWKRGYLLYGPPGTGKSSLIAAMANYLKFDIFDLQLSSVFNDATLRRLLLSTTNRSILVIEDLDCSLGSAVRRRNIEGEDKVKVYEKNIPGHDNSLDSQITLSGLLNFIDGLWSSCGDERIIIVTTNDKDKIDPALLRPGRMDMHIHMSYLTMPAFKVLASNYLDLTEEHHLFGKIEELLQEASVTPAQVAEELIRSDNPDIALSKVAELIEGFKLEQAHSKKGV